MRQPLLEHFHCMFYPLHTSNRCYPTLKILYLPPYIYQYHLRIHYTFIDTCAHTLSLQTDSFTTYRCSYSGSDTTNINLQNFCLGHPSWKFTAHYEVDTKYLGITWDKTMAVEILDQQYSTCKEANGQFCNIYTPFQPLANPPSCITALYSENFTSISARCSLQVRKAHTISIPTSIAPNVWLLTSLQSTVLTGITPVCPEGPTKLITLWKPIHIL